MALAGTVRQAEAAFTETIVFISNCITGTSVSNPTGDIEIFKMNPNGTSVRQLTFNKATDAMPTLSPEGTKIAYTSLGVRASSSEGDQGVNVMNASDGSAKKYLSNNGEGIHDFSIDWGVQATLAHIATTVAHLAGHRPQGLPAANQRRQRGGAGRTGLDHPPCSWFYCPHLESESMSHAATPHCPLH